MTGIKPHPDFSGFSPFFTVSDGYMEWYEFLTGDNPFARIIQRWRLVQTIGPEGNIGNLVIDEVAGIYQYDLLMPNPAHKPRTEMFLMAYCSYIFLAKLFGIKVTASQTEDDTGLITRWMEGGDLSWADKLDSFLAYSKFGTGYCYDPPVYGGWQYKDEIPAILVSWSKSLIGQVFALMCTGVESAVDGEYDDEKEVKRKKETRDKNRYKDPNEPEEPTGEGGEDPKEDEEEDESDSDSDVPPPMIEAVLVSLGEDDDGGGDQSESDIPPLKVHPKVRRELRKVATFVSGK